MERAGRCLTGACVSWCEGIECDDGNACTDDVCDAADGSCDHLWAQDGTACVSGEDPGRCASGVCVSLCDGVDCDDQNECTENLCDRSSGECAHPHRPDGAECKFRELPGVCESGVCVDAELCRDVDCSDGNACTDDVCDPIDASCTNPNKPDRALCSIGELPGICTSGACEGLCVKHRLRRPQRVYDRGMRPPSRVLAQTRQGRMARRATSTGFRVAVSRGSAWGFALRTTRILALRTSGTSQGARHAPRIAARQLRTVPNAPQVRAHAKGASAKPTTAATRRCLSSRC